MKADERLPEGQVFGRAIRSMLESAVDSLPEDYRTVLILRDVEGLSASETAECLNVGEEKVRMRLFRARKMLRRRLFDRIGNVAPVAFQFLGAPCDRVVERVLNRIRSCSPRT
ncbi:MAG TPA: sigma-70 family RNA polymerase sigma factor [Pyrinomonadaceae bacterium]|jgi:RNA polymerase sigma-70 factor (ECF subfamily)